MPDEEEQPERLRREKDRTVDQNLRVTTTVTFIVTVAMIVAAAVRMYGVMDNRQTEDRTRIERLERRQDTYIARDAATHDAMDEAMDDHQDEMRALREYLTLKFGEKLP